MTHGIAPKAHSHPHDHRGELPDDHPWIFNRDYGAAENPGHTLGFSGSRPVRKYKTPIPRPSAGCCCWARVVAICWDGDACSSSDWRFSPSPSLLIGFTQSAAWISPHPGQVKASARHYSAVHPGAADRQFP